MISSKDCPVLSESLQAFGLSALSGVSTPISLTLLTSCSKYNYAKAEKAPSNTTPCTVVRVVDGDTFHCTLSNGDEVKVRLIGVDTPESADNPKARRDSERTGQSLEEIIKMGRQAKEEKGCMVGKEEKEDSSERQWEGSGV